MIFIIYRSEGVKRLSLNVEQKNFIERVGKIAIDDMKKSGVLASLKIAQAILESGWGKSGMTVKANALFGIKAGASWKGKVYSAKTQEYYDGVTFTEITALFRAYDSWEESIADHSSLLTGASRYKTLIGERDYKKACKEIKAAGYATDPNYDEKLIKLIESYDLMKYDISGLETGQPSMTNSKKGMSKEMNNKEFIEKLKNVVNNFKTVYMWGVFGAPVTEANIASKARQYPSWYTASRQAALRALIGKRYFAFDCVCLIKSILWGWSGDASKTYGGATYASNGVPDINADGMIAQCKNVSTDFNGIMPGEAVWIPGHIGIYIGDGKVIECTPSWKNGVQITACLNIGAIAGMNGRRWTRRGKLPYITYETSVQAGTDTSAATSLNIGDIVDFTGTKHYTSANAATGATCKPGKAKITQIVRGAKHPYHLIREAGGGSTVYGWVDAADIATKDAKTGTPGELKQGCKVQYSGTVYADSFGGGPGRTVSGTYIVSRYIPDRKCGVLIGSVGWVPESDCKVVG